MTFRDLLNKFIKKPQLELNTSQEEGREDETPLILVDDLESILRKKDVYKSFKKNDLYYSTDGKNPDEYKKALYNYVEFLISNEVFLEKEELKRAEKITQKRYKPVKEKSEKTAKDVAIMLLRDSNLLKDFKRNKTKLFMNFKTNEIISSILSIDAMMNGLGIVDEINKYANEVRQREDEYSKTNKLSRYKIENSKIIDSDLKSLVISKIPKGISDKEELAFCIYNAVNESLEYNPIYFILNKDIADKSVRKLFQQNIENLTKENNFVICNEWAEFYSYFLNLYGLNSSIVYEDKFATETTHKWVEINIGSINISADATNNFRNKLPRVQLSDMSGVQLNLMPGGFNSPNIKKLSEKYGKQSITDKFNEIMQLINEKMLKEKNNEVNPKREIQTRIDVINDEIKKYNLDNMAMTQYIKALYNLFLYNVKDVTLSTSLYEKKRQEGRRKLFF